MGAKEELEALRAVGRQFAEQRAIEQAQKTQTTPSTPSAAELQRRVQEEQNRRDEGTLNNLKALREIYGSDIVYRSDSISRLGSDGSSYRRISAEPYLGQPTHIGELSERDVAANLAESAHLAALNYYGYHNRAYTIGPQNPPNSPQMKAVPEYWRSRFQEEDVQKKAKRDADEKARQEMAERTRREWNALPPDEKARRKKAEEAHRRWMDSRPNASGPEGPGGG